MGFSFSCVPSKALLQNPGYDERMDMFQTHVSKHTHDTLRNRRLVRLCFVAFFGLFGLVLYQPAVMAKKAKGTILLVLTNHGKLGQTGKPTGFFLSEAAHPWEVFVKAGYSVQIASPKGGFAPVDPKSYKLKDKANAAFMKAFGGKKGTRMGVPRTLKLSEAKPQRYRAIFLAGGHGTVWDFPKSKSLKRVAEAIYASGGAIGAVCHGPAGLVHLKDKKGRPLVEGKRVAAFTNAEEAAVKLTKTVPFLLESALKKKGAKVQRGANFKTNAVADGRLITGQNPASAAKAARLLVKALQNTSH